MKNPKTILFLEDRENPKLSELDILLKSGYEVICVHTDEAARESAERNGGIDLVLLNVNPGKEKERMITALKINEKKSLPIVFYVSDSDTDYLKEIIKIPSCTYAIRTPDDSSLLQAVQIAFEKMKADQEKRKTEKSFLVTLQSIGDAVGRADRELSVLSSDSGAADKTEVHGYGRHAEKELRDMLTQKEYLFRLFAENSIDLIFRYDLIPNPGFRYVSPSAFSVTGYKPKEFYADPYLVHKMIYNDDLPIWEDFISGKTRPGYSMNLRVVKKDGTVIWIEQRNIFIRESSGEIGAVEGIARDITGRKKSEQLLRKSEEKYRTLLNTMSEAAALNEIIYNADGDMIDYRISEVNKAFYSIADFSEAETVKNTASGLYGMSRDAIKTFWETHRSQNTVHYSKFTSSVNGRCFKVSASPFAEGRFVTVFFDITDSEAEAVRLRESEDRFRSMADSSPALIWMSDADMLSSGSSKSWADYTGRVMELETGNGWSGGVFHEDKDKYMKVYTEAFQSKKPFAMEYRMKRNDGQYSWIYDQGVPRYAEDGRFAGYIGACTDISELKKANEEIERLQAERQMILDNIKSGVLLLKNRRIVWANKRAANMFGYDLNELMEINTLKLSPYKEIFDLLGTQVFTVLARALQFSTEAKLTKKSGDVFWCSLTGHLIDRNDPNRGSIWNLEDISKRKAAESALKEKEALLHTIADYSYNWEYWENENQEIIYMSPSCERISGYRQEEFKHRPDLIYKMMLPEDAKKMITEREKTPVYKSEDISVAREFKIMKKDGSAASISHISRPLFDENRKFVGRRISNADITGRRKYSFVR